MKHIFLVCLVLSCGFAHAQDNTDKTHDVWEEQPLDTIVLGDINGDRVIDTAYVYTPPVLSTYDEDNKLVYTFGCKDDKCYNRVTFSCNLPDLVFEESVWGKVAAVDDIDGDSIKELLFNTGWFIGSTTGLYLYHFNGKEWEVVERVTMRGWLGDEDFSLSNVFYKKGKKYYLKGIALKEVMKCLT